LVLDFTVVVVVELVVAVVATVIDAEAIERLGFTREDTMALFVEVEEELNLGFETPS
jgi:hypothetical protein